MVKNAEYTERQQSLKAEYIKAGNKHELFLKLEAEAKKKLDETYRERTSIQRTMKDIEDEILDCTREWLRS